MTKLLGTVKPHKRHKWIPADSKNWDSVWICEIENCPAREVNGKRADLY